MFKGEVLTMMEVLSRNVAGTERCRVTVNNSLTIASLYMSKTFASICAIGVLAKIKCRIQLQRENPQTGHSQQPSRLTSPVSEQRGQIWCTRAEH